MEALEESPSHAGELTELLVGTLDRAHISVPPNAKLDDLIGIAFEQGFLHDVDESQSGLSVLREWLRGVKARWQ